MLPSRTDAIRDMVLHELEQHRVWLDRMPTVRSIRFDVKISKETGLPRVVILSTESEGEGGRNK